MKFFFLLSPLSLQLACSGDVSVIDKEDSNDTSGCESLVWFPDADGDGFGGIDAVSDCDQPEGYVDNNLDCNDSESTINPNATETCNSIDDDCDNEIDEDAEAATWYADADGDGYGDPNSASEACEQPSGTVDNNLDCNDADLDINPEAVEICNSVDDDCNNLVDDDPIDSSLWYEDSDSDSFGNADNSTEACEQPSGYVDNSDDCDDSNSDFTLSCDPVVVATSCASQPYSVAGPSTSQPELHILSAYEPSNTDILVHISRNAPMTVLLSSYDAVNWIVTVDPAATVNAILINGYHSQTVSIPNGIPYEIRSYDQTVSNFGEWCGYSLPYNGGGCDTNNLIAGVQAHTGLGWSSFNGCYTASEFLLQ